MNREQRQDLCDAVALEKGQKARPGTNCYPLRRLQYCVLAVLLSGHVNHTVAANVSTPTYFYNLSASATDFGPGGIDNNFAVTPEIPKFPVDWGTLNTVTVEYLSSTGGWDFSTMYGAESGIASGLALIGSALYQNFGLFATASDSAPEAAVELSYPAVAVGGPLHVAEFDGISLNAPNVPSFLSSDPSFFQFRTDIIVQADINALAAFLPTMSANVMGSYRVTYGFDPSQAYFDAGSPAVIPLPPAWGLLTIGALVCAAFRRQKR